MLEIKFALVMCPMVSNPTLAPESFCLEKLDGNDGSQLQMGIKRTIVFSFFELVKISVATILCTKQPFQQ